MPNDQDSIETKTEFGTSYWKNSKGELHRLDGPAFINRRKHKEEYWIDGERISKQKFDILNGKEVKVSPKDECQVCAGTFSLKNGLLVKHGFKRPGTGRLHGRCMGEGHLPFPDTVALVQYLRALQDWTANMEKAVDKYNSGEIDSLDVTSALGKQFTITKDGDSWTWEREYKRAKRNAEEELKSLQNEVLRVTDRIGDANRMKNTTTTESILRSTIRSILKEELRMETGFKYGPVADEDLHMELLGHMVDARDGIIIKDFVYVTEIPREKVVQAMKQLVRDGLAERSSTRSFGEQTYYVTDAGRKAFNDYMSAPKEVDESWVDDKGTAKKLASTIAKKYGKGFGGKLKWADEWSDNPKAVAGKLADMADDEK